MGILPLLPGFWQADGVFRASPFAIRYSLFGETHTNRQDATAATHRELWQTVQNPSEDANAWFE